MKKKKNKNIFLIPALSKLPYRSDTTTVLSLGGASSLY